MLFLTVEILFHRIINGHLQPPQHDCNEAACASATDQVKNVACEEMSIGVIERMRKLIYYSEQQNCSHVWKLWIVDLIEGSIKCEKLYKYSPICPIIQPI